MVLSAQPSFEQPSESSAESSSVGREFGADTCEPAEVADAVTVTPPPPITPLATLELALATAVLLGALLG